MKKILNFSLIILGIFTLFFSFNNFTSAQSLNAPCKVKNAYFQPAGTQPDAWYSDTNKPTVKIVIETENCAGKELDISLLEDDYGVANDDAVEGLDNIKLNVIASNITEITVKAGEDECEIRPNLDCDYFYIEVKGDVEDNYVSEGKPGGELKYECDSFCDENFEFVGTNYGNARAVWFFFGTGVSDQRGPYETIAACNQAREDFKTTTGNESNSRCFFKLTFDPTPPPPTQFTAGTSSYDNTYELLAPIPGVVPGNVVGPDFNLGNYVNNLIKVIIGLASAMAVFMIVFGGIEWMMSDSFVSKGQGKKKILDAIKGLVLALGSYLILITINPNLVIIDFRLDKQTIDIQKDEAAYEPYDNDTPTTSSGYKIKGSSFQSPSPTNGVPNFVSNLTSGYSINKITVNTSSKKALFVAKKTGSPDIQVEVPIEIGSNGTSAPGKGKSGDKKTPIGNFKIGTDRRFSTSTNPAVFTRDKKTNLGSMFITIVQERGIGFHGQKDNLLRKTNGCVRMYNDDLILLAPHMKTGVDVQII